MVCYVDIYLEQDAKTIDIIPSTLHSPDSIYSTSGLKKAVLLSHHIFPTIQIIDDRGSMGAAVRPHRSVVRPPLNHFRPSVRQPWSCPGLRLHALY